MGVKRVDRDASEASPPEKPPRADQGMRISPKRPAAPHQAIEICHSAGQQRNVRQPNMLVWRTPEILKRKPILNPNVELTRRFEHSADFPQQVALNPPGIARDRAGDPL